MGYLRFLFKEMITQHINAFTIINLQTLAYAFKCSYYFAYIIDGSIETISNKKCVHTTRMPQTQTL